MVAAIRRGISEVISIEWMSMFASHELQILIAGYEEIFTAKDLKKHCEMRFAAETLGDRQYEQMCWEVVDALSKEDKMAFLK